MTKRPYVPAPVNMNAIDRTIAQSIAAIERSCALLSRLDAASTIITCADVPSLNRLVLIETESRSLAGLWVVREPAMPSLPGLAAGVSEGVDQTCSNNGC